MKSFVLSCHERPLTQVLFSRDGSILFSASKGVKVFASDTDTGEIVGIYSGIKGAVHSLGISYCEKYLIAGSADACIRVFDIYTCEVVVTIQLRGTVRFIDCSRENSRFVVAMDNFTEKVSATVSLWDTRDLSMIPNQEEQDSRVNIHHREGRDADIGPVEIYSVPLETTKRLMVVRFGIQDKKIIGVSEQGIFYIRSAINGELLRELDTSYKTTKFQLSLDRTLLVAGSENNLGFLIRCDDWSIIKSYKSDRKINDVCIFPQWRHKNSPERRQIVVLGGGQDASNVTTTAGMEGRFQACFHHMVYEREVSRLEGHFGPVNTIAVSESGIMFSTGSEDGTVRLYCLSDDEEWRLNKTSIWDDQVFGDVKEGCQLSAAIPLRKEIDV